jgi:hypothetical protein
MKIQIIALLLIYVENIASIDGYPRLSQRVTMLKRMNGRPHMPCFTPDYWTR